MKRILIGIVMFVLSAPTFAAKWNPVTGDDLQNTLHGFGDDWAS